MGSPIQLVHDVSREVELGSSQKLNGGLFQVGLTLTHVAADSQENTYSPWEVGVTGFPDPILDDDEWAWLLRIGQQSQTNVDASWSVVVACAAGGTFQGGDFVVARGEAASLVINESVAGLVDININSAEDGGFFPGLPFPLLKTPFDVGRVRVRSDSSAAGNNRFNLLFWRGKIGAFPPGLR